MADFGTLLPFTGDVANGRSCQMPAFSVCSSDLMDRLRRKVSIGLMGRNLLPLGHVGKPCPKRFTTLSSPTESTRTYLRTSGK